MGVIILRFCRNKVLLALSALVLSGCSSVLSCDDGREVRWFNSPTEHMLNNAISSFEDGNYTSSMTVLQRLVANAAATKKEKLKAYKYLAFIHCISAREKMCRESFEKAFALDPNFSLTQAEAGHPVWGPVFSSVKYKSVK